jgi:hypothetical protein
VKVLRITKVAVVLSLTALVPLAAYAQFVKGNEAVRVMPDGTKKVETAPVPATGPANKNKPCAADAACHAGAWHMLETADGLKECTEPFARPTTCRASTYGTTKLSRLWIVKKGTSWLWCQYPDMTSKCVDMNARPPSNLPYDAVQ